MLRHVTSMEFSAFCVVGKTRQTTSGLSTDFYPKMYQILYKISECLLLFGAESSVFHFATENFKDYNIQKYNFAC